MQSFTVEEVRAACGGRYIGSAEGGAEISGVTIDSRKACEGMLFVPVKGERVDGHDYIPQAVEAGAVSLCETGHGMFDGVVIEVKNTVDAIGKIAHAYKMKYNVPTVGITGSVGKTTTKDMIAAVMAKKFGCLKTQGNFNNELGLPLTVFGLESHHTAAVLEMGMSAFGEIHHLADIARPDVGVITNIGMSHIENLGTREGILKAKMEICDFFGEGNLLIVNGDNDLLKTVGHNGTYKIETYGIESEGLTYRGYDIEDLGLDGCRFKVDIGNRQHLVTVGAAGVHNVYNALAAIAVGMHYGIDIEEIKAAVAGFELTAMRMSVEKTGGITLINDCYNASPDSIRASLGVLKSAPPRRVAVLGDVLELGSYAEKAHLEIGGMCAESSVDVLICAGNNARYIAEGAAGVPEVHYFETTQQAAEFAAKTVKIGDTVLVKASRGMHFEDICSVLMK